MRSKWLLLTVLLLGAGGLQAHPVTEAECEAPIRPVNDQSDALWQAFLVEIDGFRACTQRRMEWHQAAVVEHQAQAKQAVEQWNEFVRTSLNAPEDFPWPPQEKP